NPPRPRGSAVRVGDDRRPGRRGRADRPHRKNPGARSYVVATARLTNCKLQIEDLHRADGGLPNSNTSTSSPRRGGSRDYASTLDSRLRGNDGPGASIPPSNFQLSPTRHDERAFPTKRVSPVNRRHDPDTVRSTFPCRFVCGPQVALMGGPHFLP